MEAEPEQAKNFLTLLVGVYLHAHSYATLYHVSGTAECIVLKIVLC